MMSILFWLFQGAPVQQSVSSGSGTGDLNNYTWVIICALAGVIVTMGTFGARFIKRLYEDLRKCQEERAKFVEEQLALLQTLSREFGKHRD